MQKKIKFICTAAIIAAIYVSITYVTQGLSSGVLQIRIAEALCVLTYFTPSAAIGVTLGCLLSNLAVGAMPLDIAFGTLATLLGATVSLLARRHKWLVPLPTLIANALIIPPVLSFVYGASEAYILILASVCCGECIALYGIGMPLLLAIEKRNIKL